MNPMPFVCLYASYLDTLAPFTDAERGRLLFGMLRYSQTGQTPEFKGREKLIWPTLLSQLDRDIEKYQIRCEVNRRNGAKGGKTKAERLLAEQLAADGYQTPAIAPKEKENEKENKNENEKDKENEREREKENANAAFSASPLPPPLIPPDAKAVQLYCVEKNLDFDPERFVDYYTATGWTRGGTPIRDWKAAARCWASRESENC